MRQFGFCCGTAEAWSPEIAAFRNGFLHAFAGMRSNIARIVALMLDMVATRQGFASAAMGGGKQGKLAGKVDKLVGHNVRDDSLLLQFAGDHQKARGEQR